MGVSHKAFYGMTDQGKTWAMKRIARQLLRRKQKVIVYSGVGDFNWGKAAKTTACADELERLLRDPRNYGSFVFLDEGMILYDEITRKSHPFLYSMFNVGRHKGYTFYIATQYPTSIPRRVRVNCAECFCFKLGDEESAKMVYRDFNSQTFNGKPLWKAIMGLKQCSGFHIKQPTHIKKISLR